MSREVSRKNIWFAVRATGCLLILFASLAGAAAAPGQNPIYGWTRIFGETSGGGRAMSVAVDASGNVYMTGSFNGVVNFAADFGGSDVKTSAGDNDIFITRVNADGSYGWTRRMGGSGVDVGYDISCDSSGNVYVAGRFEGAVNFAGDFGDSETKSSLGADVFITRIDASGAYAWTKRIPGDLNKLGAISVAVDSSGNVFVVGDFYTEINFAADFGGSDVKAPDIVGFDNIFITRINADLTYGWTKKLGEKGHAYGRGVSVDSGVNVYVVGYFKGAAVSSTVNFAADFGGSDVKNSLGDYDVCITQIDRYGDYGWTRTMGGAGADYGYGVSVDPSGNVYATGYFEGTVDFAEDFGGSDIKISAGERDIFVSRISKYGDYGWTRRMGGAGYDEGRDISVDASGTVFVTGWINGPVDFAEDFEESDLKNKKGNDAIFVARINNGGGYRWTRVMGDPYHMQLSYGVDADPSGNVFLTGNFGGTVDFAGDFGGEDVKTATTFGVSDIFLMKIINPDDADDDGLLDGNEDLSSCPSPIDPDSDGDGLCDGKFTVPGTCIAGEDINVDGKMNAGETDPCNPDSDGDFLSDGEEVTVFHTKPRNPDTDGDGVGDGKEIYRGTDPLKSQVRGGGDDAGGGCTLAADGTGAGAGWALLPLGIVVAWRVARGRKKRPG